MPASKKLCAVRPSTAPTRGSTRIATGPTTSNRSWVAVSRKNARDWASPPIVARISGMAQVSRMKANAVYACDHKGRLR